METDSAVADVFRAADPESRYLTSKAIETITIYATILEFSAPVIPYEDLVIDEKAGV
jgi:hypothetical protein